MLWFVRQSLVLLVLAWVLGLACGFVLFGRRRGWAEPVTDVIPVIAPDGAEQDGERVDEGWVAADADADLRAVVDDGDDVRAWSPVGADWDPVPAHHDYADPVWAAEAGITDDLLARRADVVAAEPVVEPVTEPVAEPVTAAAARPALQARAAAPRGTGDGDDLTRIDGVSAEAAAALHASGLRSFTAVSRSTTDDLRAALSAAGLAPTFKAAYWPLIAGDLARAAVEEQARAAAAEVVTDGAGEPVTVDVTDEVTAGATPVDVTDAVADPLVAQITAGGPGARL